MTSRVGASQPSADPAFGDAFRVSAPGSGGSGRRGREHPQRPVLPDLSRAAHLRALALLCLAPLAATAPGARAADPCDGGDIRPASDNLEQVRASVSCLIDAARADRNEPPLRESDQLGGAAQRMTDLMVGRSFFSHQTPDGSTLADRVRRTGYLPETDRWLLGENLAWGTGALGTPRAIVEGWLNSAEHRENIFDPGYEDIGVGVTLGSPRAGDGRGATYAVDFGTQDTRPAVKVPGHLTADRARAGSEGISFSATCSRPCTLVARLFSGAAHTAQARASVAKRVVVAAGRLRLRLGGTGTLALHPRRAAKRPLRRKLSLVTEAAGTPVERTTQVTLD